MRRDVIVIGASAAGRSAALEAARCGLGVQLFAGDDCALGRAAAGIRVQRIRAAVEHRLAWAAGAPDAAADGLDLGELVEVDVQCELSRVRGSHPWIDVATEAVELASPRSVRTADGKTYEAPILILAGDAHVRRPERFAFDDRLVCDAESVWLRGALPGRAVVIGADAEGCAVACLLGFLGVPVTAIDRRAHSLRYLDRDVLDAFRQAALDMGVELLLGEEVADVSPVDERPGCVEVTLGSGRAFACDTLVVAGGRESGTAPLHLERAGVETDARGFVLADDRGRTSQRGIYAVGRAVALGPSADEYFGRAVVRAALGLTDDAPASVPLVAGSVPEVAMAGLTAERCVQLDVPHVATVAPLGDTPRGKGLLKLVVHQKAKTLLGVQVVGLRAREIVQLGSLLVARDRPVRELLSLTAGEGSPCAAYAAAARDALRCTLPPDLPPA